MDAKNNGGVALEDGTFLFSSKQRYLIKRFLWDLLSFKKVREDGGRTVIVASQSEPPVQTDRDKIKYKIK